MRRSIAAKVLSRVATRLGYRLVPVHPDETEGFVLYPYVKEDGSFDYERYREVQEEGNKRKIDLVWAIEKNIEFLSDYILSHIERPMLGVCHGTRGGQEQEWFRKYLGCEVIGTEISSTAHDAPHTIQWDFHEVKDEWIDSVDFIYSNSFDHSYDPERCLNAWMTCVRPGGLCILEHTSNHEPGFVNELDPFGAWLVHMPYLITMWGRGRYGVRELAPAPVQRDDVLHTTFIVIQRF